MGKLFPANCHNIIIIIVCSYARRGPVMHVLIGDSLSHKATIDMGSYAVD